MNENTENVVVENDLQNLPEDNLGTVESVTPSAVTLVLISEQLQQIHQDNNMLLLVILFIFIFKLMKKWFHF